MESKMRTALSPLRTVVAVAALLASCATKTVTATETSPGPTEPSVVAPGATMADPISRGQTSRLDDWEVGVVGFTPDANEFVRTPRWNDRPRPGYQFVLVKLSIKNLGTEASQPQIRSTIVVPEDESFFRLRWDLVYPHEIDNIGRMPPGTATQANRVFEVPTEDVPGATMVHVSEAPDGAFFALRW